MAERKGFEPLCLVGKRFSRPPRYDHFDNPPRLFQSVELKIRPWKKERTTGENKQKYSVVKVQKSLINQGFSGINVPITSTNFKAAFVELSVGSNYREEKRLNSPHLSW